jgi:hypothetical protein
LAGIAVAQESITSRVFTYDGSPATNGSVTFQVSGSSFAPSLPTTVGRNSVSNTSAGGASFGLDLDIDVATYVLVSGVFDAIFDVNGYGPGKVTHSADVEIRTNRSLSVVAAGFGPLQDTTPGSGGKPAGTISYTLAALPGFPASANAGAIAQSPSGTDQDFDGKGLNIPIAQLPASGEVTLRLARTLNVNSFAQGAKTYRADGILILTVN